MHVLITRALSTAPSCHAKTTLTQYSSAPKILVLSDWKVSCTATLSRGILRSGLNTLFLRSILHYASIVARSNKKSSLLLTLACSRILAKLHLFEMHNAIMKRSELKMKHNELYLLEGMKSNKIQQLEKNLVTALEANGELFHVKETTERSINVTRNELRKANKIISNLKKKNEDMVRMDLFEYRKFMILNVLCLTKGYSGLN
ncbi:hypothetical protein RJT34_05632 [Clitoria ternatea]|uniref:Uncharacterized protein n=1 Tax=Clitoria ternatea TaxID=43366 RepID=A0AAN9K2W5_CLITE